MSSEPSGEQWASWADDRSLPAKARTRSARRQKTTAGIVGARPEEDGPRRAGPTSCVDAERRSVPGAGNRDQLANRSGSRRSRSVAASQACGSIPFSLAVSTERGDCGPVVATIVGAGEKGVLAAERERADGAFDCDARQRVPRDRRRARLRQPRTNTGSGTWMKGGFRKRADRLLALGPGLEKSSRPLSTAKAAFHRTNRISANDVVA